MRPLPEDWVASLAMPTVPTAAASVYACISLPSACQTSAHALHGNQDLPERRGFTLREIVSQFLVTMQFPSCHSELRSGCLGVSDALLLKDGDMIALYEYAFGYETGHLGPDGRCQPAFQFREAILDRPSLEASAAAQVLVAEERSDVRQLIWRDVPRLEWSHDRGSYDAVFLSALRRLLDGAGRGTAHVQACLMAADGLRGPYTVTTIVLQISLPGLFDSHDSHNTYRTIKMIVNND
jgi:hypothetical protein